MVEEIVKILVENNLYIKPEKCKWKVKEIGFLGVIIKLEEIKMKEEKCYELKSLESDNRTTFVLSNIRELNRELFYKLVYLI